uniref:Uncharacterized protein n=1 Tax=Tetraselmis sp. GSL018 TaxID=582737 RepID=A0A061SF70_9CHLO
MELVPEFTSLIEWGPGSSIGWHHDANRPYLRRRDYTGAGASPSGRASPGRSSPGPARWLPTGPAPATSTASSPCCGATARP